MKNEHLATGRGGDQALDPDGQDVDSGNVLEVTGLTVATTGRRGARSGPPLVNDVSFSIGAGEVVAIVGESGSGKSTLCRAILRLLPRGLTQTGGSITLCGRTIDSLSEAAMARLRGRLVGSVFQDPLSALNPVRRTRPQLLETRRIHFGRTSAAEQRRWADETLAELGFTDAKRVLSAYPHELSGGMRQRVCIGIAYSAEPRLVIADEPVTSLDVSLQRRVLDALMERRARTNASLLVVAHDMDVVRSVAHRVIVMFGGRIVEQGPTDAVLDSPRHPYSTYLLESESASRQGRRAWQELAARRPVQWGLGPSRGGGCPYAQSCERALEECATTFPPGQGTADGHAVWCWNPVRPGSD
jgi:oligopeptide/dipeptide ABC transporter ATP-binding protein